MFLLLVELNAKPSTVAEVENLLLELVEVARQESGNLVYAVHRRQDNPEAFVLYELYKDRAAWEAHLALEAVQKAIRQFETMLLAAPGIVCCDTVALSGVVPCRSRQAG